MPQLDSLNYFNQFIGLFLYLSFFYYSILSYLLPHTLALFKANEWMLNKIISYTFHIKEEKLNCILFFKPKWRTCILCIQKNLQNSRQVHKRLAFTEQHLLASSLFFIIEDRNASL